MDYTSQYDEIDMSLDKVEVLNRQVRYILENLDELHSAKDLQRFHWQYGAVKEDLDYLTTMLIDYVDAVRKSNDKWLELERKQLKTNDTWIEPKRK